MASAFQAACAHNLPSPDSDGAPLAPPLPQWPAMLLGIAVFALLSAWAGITSKGFLEADGCVHYQYARYAFHEHHLFVNVWGRPFCTAIYCLPAHFGGLAGVRLASLVIAIVIGLITYRIARNQGYLWPGLALIFLIGQPMVFLHSFSELTELPFCLLLALGFWAYQKKQWFWTAVIASLLPTARPEGFGFLALAAVAMLFHRRKRCIPLLLVPLIAWHIAGWYYSWPGRPQPWYREIPLWLWRNWPYSPTSVYGRGSLLHFVMMLPAIISPFVFPAVLVGLWRCFEFRKQTRLWLEAAWDSVFGDDHRLRIQWLIAIIPLGILTGHSLLYWAGRMASSGEPRYMAVAAPMWALLAAKGWEWAFARFGWRRPMAWAGLAVLLPILANVTWKVIPLKMSEDWQRAEEVAKWYGQSPYREKYPFVIGMHPGIKYYQDVSPSNPEVTPIWDQDVAEHPPRGMMMIWDPIYARFNADERKTITVEQMEKFGWVEVKDLPLPPIMYQPPAPGRFARVWYRIRRPVMGWFGKDVAEPAQAAPREVVGEWHIFLSPLDIDGNPTRRP